MDTASSPLVTVVTPCLNPGPRLARCLDSVADQTYDGQIEHVVIDGGSVDGTVDLLRARDGVRFVSEPDRGQSDAINKGFAMASGDYLTWLNADDTLRPDAVRLAVEQFTSSSGVGWVYGDLEYHQDRQRWIFQAPHELTIKSFRDRVPVPQPGSFVARWAWERVGPLAEDLDLAMDLDLWMRLLGADVAPRHVDEVLATFELHEGSKTAQTDLRPRFREQTLVYARHGHAELAIRAAERWSWYETMRRFQSAVAEKRWREARRAALAEVRRHRTLRPQRLLGLALMALVPRTGARMLRRTGAWAD